MSRPLAMENVFRMAQSETWPLGFDFSRDLLVGETIQSVVGITIIKANTGEAAPAGTLVGSPIISGGDTVTQTVDASQLDIDKYLMTVTVEVASNKKPAIRIFLDLEQF